MAITLNGTTGISGVDGSSSTPSYKGSDSNTGISFGTDTVTINTGGTARVTTDASGNVGIGTASPTYRLEVNGNAYFSNITLPSAGVTIGTGSVGSIAGAAIQMFGVGTGTYMTLSTNGSERFRLDASGNLGLGVTPSAWGSGYKAIQINGRSSIASDNGNRIWLNSDCFYNGTNWIYGSSGASVSQYQIWNGQHQWFNAPSGTAGAAITFTQAMTLDASGNLGVGTASPSDKLHVAGAGKFTGQSASLDQTGAYIDYASGIARVTGQNSAGGVLAFYTNQSGNFVAERARINSGGDFLLGTTDNPTGIRAVIRSDNAQVRIGPSTNNRYRSDYYVNTAGEGNINVYDDTGGVYRPLTVSSSYLAIHRGAGETARFNENGDLGLGTASPRNGGAGFKGITVNGSTGGFVDIHSNGVQAITMYSTGTSGAIFSPSGSILFQPAGVERARFNTVGTLEQAVANGVPQLSNLIAGSYANGATVGFANFSGMIIVNNWDTGSVYIWIVGGSGVVVVSNVGTTGGSIAYDAGIAGYRWTATSGATHAYTFTAIRTRNTA